MTSKLDMGEVAHKRLTPHTLSQSPGEGAPIASIDDMAWFAGHWVGEAFGGISEELWTDPKGGAMVGTYRLVRDGKPVFYELMMLVEEKGSLVLRLKHFNPDLTGWEEKDKTIDFPLVKTGSNDIVYFEGLTFERNGQDKLTLFLAIKQKDGSLREEVLTYKRA